MTLHDTLLKTILQEGCQRMNWLTKVSDLSRPSMCSPQRQVSVKEQMTWLISRIDNAYISHTLLKVYISVDFGRCFEIRIYLNKIECLFVSFRPVTFTGGTSRRKTWWSVPEVNQEGGSCDNMNRSSSGQHVHSITLVSQLFFCLPQCRPTSVNPSASSSVERTEWTTSVSLPWK